MPVQPSQQPVPPAGSPSHVENGQALSFSQLDDASVSLLYEQVRAIAHRLRSERFYSESLGATDLAHETLARMLGQVDAQFTSRRHMLDVAAKVMHRLLIDRLRRRAIRQVALEEVRRQQRLLGAVVESELITGFSEEMQRLEQRRPQAAAVLRYRYFFLMTLNEVAEVLDCSVATAHRELAFGRAFLTQPGRLCSGEDALATPVDAKMPA